jgi:endogenous inhibitor of DNA gyrase (YacG/DUF329 family)
LIDLGDWLDENHRISDPPGDGTESGSGGPDDTGHRPAKH